MTDKNYLMCDFHVHSTYCDGKSSLREVADAAYERGMTTLGFSTHSYTHFDESYCIMPAQLDAYRNEILELKAQYAGRMQILCGVEQDYWSTYPTDDFDYVIGSVHYVRAGDKYYAIDHRRDLLLDAASDGFGGDIYALIEEYYRTIGDIAARVKPDIIGHFDVITKFNEKQPFFDEGHPRYLAARRAALDTLLAAGIPFEVNTGAISRGHKTTPYPAEDALRYIRERGGTVLPTSDSHSRDTLCYRFDSVVPPLSDLGFSVADAQRALLARISARMAEA